LTSCRNARSPNWQSTSSASGEAMMSDTDREALHLIGGPFDGVQVQLTETPLHIDIDSVRYKRLDDPDTGEFLGAYGMSHEAQVETIARIMTGEQGGNQ